MGMDGLTAHIIVDPRGSVVSATVDPKGSVASAICGGCASGLAAQAEAAVRAIQYSPFERSGHAVWVQFDETVLVLPPERRPVRQVQFPLVNDWNAVQIKLRRTSCYGLCPAYSVEIQGNGNVLFEGVEGWVAEAGQHRATIPKEAVTSLVDAFRNADFYALDDEYVWSVFDLPTYETSIEIDGRLKKVKDYGGLHIGMPATVTKLEDLIDQLADTQRWVKFQASKSSTRNP